MLKKLFSAIAIIAAVALLSLTAFSAAPANAVEKENQSETVVEVTADKEKVLEARLLNMLNHNYVYNDSFMYVEDIVNESVVALLNMRDIQDDSFISENIIREYVYDMYGIEIDDFSNINSDFPKKEGFVYILPRGFSLYEHSILNVKQNEDGSYWVETKVEVSYHDSSDEILICDTLFVENQNSQFGYNIISSNISVKTLLEM